MSVPCPPFISTDRQGISERGETFHQAPYIRCHERIEKGIRVRKQLRKYIETLAGAEKESGQLLQNDSHLSTLLPDTIDGMHDVFEKLQEYNTLVSQEKMEAFKTIFESAQPFDHSSRVRKWNNSTYNMVQKCVQDVNAADKKMDRSIQRVTKATEDVEHWEKVHLAGTQTLQVQPTSQECLKTVQTATTKLSSAREEERLARVEYEECCSTLEGALERRDALVFDTTEYTYQLEQDRVTCIVDTLKEFIRVKQRTLQAEQQALQALSETLEHTDTKSTLTQFVRAEKHPALVHKSTRALELLEWHQSREAPDEEKTTAEYSDLTPNDVQVIGDYTSSCFVRPCRRPLKSNPSKHRARFLKPQLYQIQNVRRLIVQTLNQQRTECQELTINGYRDLNKTIRLMLDACVVLRDYETAKNIMNMIQTFYLQTQDEQQVYLKSTHDIWKMPEFWGEALLLGVSLELKKSTTLSHEKWFHLTPTKRTEVVLTVHNIVFGQLGTLVHNMSTFGRLGRDQIQQFSSHVVISFDLTEDQWLTLQSQIETLSCVEENSTREFILPNIFPEIIKTKSKPPTAGLKSIFKGFFETTPAVASKETRGHSGSWEHLFG